MRTLADRPKAAPSPTRSAFSGGPQRLITVALWIAICVGAALLGTQLLGWTISRSWATFQSLTPYVVVGVGAVAFAALRSKRHAAGVTAAVVGLVGLVFTSPVALSNGETTVPDGTPEFRIATVNLLFENTQVDEVALQLEDLELDALVLVEYTPAHRNKMLNSALASQFPYKLNGEYGRSSGIAIWSRTPFIRAEFLPLVNRSAEVSIETSAGPLRIMGVHPPTPIDDYPKWVRDLRFLADLVDDRDEPLVMLGDFNATYWHPPFREILDAGLTSAHNAHGRGFSTSWPTGGIIPAFVRLDHALVGNGAIATAVEDIDTIGSDHAGLVVTVAVAP